MISPSVFQFQSNTQTILQIEYMHRHSFGTIFCPSIDQKAQPSQGHRWDVWWHHMIPSIVGLMLAFGSLLLIMCLCIGLYTCLCGFILMCCACCIIARHTRQLLYNQQHPLGGTPAQSETTSAMIDVVTVYKIIL